MRMFSFKYFINRCRINNYFKYSPKTRMKFRGFCHEIFPQRSSVLKKKNKKHKSITGVRTKKLKQMEKQLFMGRKQNLVNTPY